MASNRLPRPPGTTTSSSSVQPFPRLSPHQQTTLDRILTHCNHADYSWSHLTQARTRAGVDPASPDGDDDLYALLLALTWQDGTTWHEKWANAQLQQQHQNEDYDSTRALHHRGHRHSRRPSDGVDLLKQKLASVDFSNPAHPLPSTFTSTPRRPPSTPLEAVEAAAGHSRFSSSRRPRLTPPIVARPLLVQAEPGYSSSDDYVGVPRARAIIGSNARAPLPRTVSKAAEGTPRAGVQPSAHRQRAEEPVASTSTSHVPRPSAMRQKTPPAAVVVEDSPSSPRHPLLSRRLLELSHPPPPLSPSHSSPSPVTRLPPRSRRPSFPSSHHPAAHDSDPSTVPDLICGQFSPPEAYALASSFDRLRLLSRAWDGWASRREFLVAREEELDSRRGRWLLRCGVQQWRVRVEGVAEMGRKAEEWAGEEGEGERKARRREGRKALGRWREKLARRREETEEELKRKEREKREADLRGARDEVVRRRNRRVGKRALEHWYHLTLLRRSSSFRRHSLLSRSLSHLRRRLSSERHRAAELEALAVEEWQRKEAERAKAAFEEWHRLTEIRGRERDWREAKEEGLAKGVLETWMDRRRQAEYLRDLDSAADQQYAVKLASTSLSRWKRRQDHLSSLDTLASQHSTSLGRRLSLSSLTHWRLQTRLSLSLRSSSTALLSRSLSTWLTSYEHLETELLGRALAFSARKDGQLLVVSFSAWADASEQRARLASAADAVYRRGALAKALGRWRKRVGEVRMGERKAEVVRGFMSQRAAWRVWVEKSWERKRTRWVEEKKQVRMKEALDFWLQQSRQKQQDRLFEQQVVERGNQRLLASSLSRWASRVVLRRELELEASKLAERNLLQRGFTRWADETVKAAERLLLADSVRAGRLDELRDRSFHHWLLSTRRSLDLEARLASFTAAKQETLREEAFGKWREGRLRRLAKEVAEKREKGLRRAAWEGWEGRSKALTATRFYRSRLTRRAFSTWEQWTPPVELVRQAIESDRQAIGRGAVQVWQIKAQARMALKGLSRLRLHGSSPSSPPPAPRPSLARPLRASTAASPLSSTSPATPTPSLVPRPRQTALSSLPATPLHRASFSSARSRTSASPSLDASAPQSAATTPGTSIRPTSLSLSTSSRSLLSSSHSSSLIPPSQPSCTAATSASSSRPRLSADLSGLPSAPAPRTRSKSISSARSVQTSRSAPAPGGARVFSDSEEEEEEDVRGGGRGRGGAQARSEGGSSTRDVRGEYKALRERLQEAAARARRGV